MIDDDQPTTPPPSPPPPPIAPAPSPFGLGRRLLGSIRALSSAIALPSPPPASSSPRLGLSLLLHLKPDLQLHDPPPPPPSSTPSASASHQDQEQAEDPLLHQTHAAAPTHASKAKRALHHLLLPQPTPCSSLAPAPAPAAAAVEHHQEEPVGLVDDGQEEEGALHLHLHTQGAAKGDQPCAGGDEPSPTKGLNSVVEQDKGDKVDLPVTKQGTLLSIQDHVAAGDDHHRDEVQQQQRTSVVDHHQLKVDASAHPRKTDDAIAVQEQDELASHGLGMGSTENDDAVEGQEVVEQGVVAGVGQGTDATAVDGDDQEKKPLEQCTSTSCEELRIAENNDAEDGQQEVEQGVIDQGDATIDDDNAVKDHEVLEQGVIDDAIAVDDAQEKPLEQCTSTSCEELGTTMENDGAKDDQEEVEQGVVVGMGQGTYATAVDGDLEKPLEQCSSTSCEELGTAENGDAEDGQEAVEQGVINQGGAAVDDNAVKDHEVVGQSVINDAIAVDDDQEKALEQCTTYGHLGTTMANDDDAVQVQEVVEQQDATQPRDEDIAAEGQETLEGHDLGSTENADAVQVQEAVVDLGVIGTDGESADATAVNDYDKAVEQCATYDDLGTTMENDGAKDDQEEVEQGVFDQGDATMENDGAKDDQEEVEQGVIDQGDATMDDDNDVKDDIAAVEDQGKNVEQCTTYDDLGTTMKNDDAVDDQQVVEQGVVNLTMDDDASVEEQEVVEEGVVDLTMDDDSVADHKVLRQGIIDGTDNIAVEKQEKVLEQCSRATKDEYTVKEKEMVVEQGVIDPKYMDLATEDQDKLSIIDDQGTVPMDYIVVKDHDKAVVQYASDAIVTIKDESPVEEHDTVGNQGLIDKNGRTKDDIDVEGHGYVKEQVIIDKWGTSSYATALEDQKNEAEPCISDDQIAGKDKDGVHAEGNMLEQRTGDKQGATQSDFTVDKHKDVVEHVRHEWGAPEDDLAMDTTAYQGTRDWSIVNKEKVKLPEDDRAMDTAAYQGTGDWVIVNKEKYKMPARRYPQKPRKLNCPSYMSKGTCTYGPSCHFNHPPQLNAKTNDSWRPSERRNHGAEILELNRLGLPIREGARNCDYYMRTGACRYGKNCHFNHPDHVIDAQFNPPTGWEDNALQMEKSSDHTLIETSHMKKSSDDATLNDRPHLKKSSDDATLDDRSHLKKTSDGAAVDDTSYSKKSSDHDTSSSSGVLPPNIFRMLLPPQKVLPSTEGKAKKKSDWSSASDDSDGCCSADSSDGPLCKQGEHVDYPDRPGRQECPFLARYGDCKFASACKYHHPKQSKDKEQVKYPERPGRPDCPFYMRYGDCKFASACNYHHPKDRYPAGLPEEPECPFYMKRGFCKFGAQCKFYHPEDANPTMQSPTDAKRSVTTDEHHLSTRITPEDHVPQQPQYPERRSITTDEHHPSTRITPEDHVLPQQPQYPERPGQPDCRYYLQFGKCKYLSACIFHHPKDRLAAGWNPSDPAHSDQIGPEIHGMPDCPFYMKSGKCQFGSLCEFRHPKDIYSTTEEAFGERTGLGAYDSLTRSENGVEQQEGTIMYPERPGEPECAHYMRKGYCKFQMNCKYHHPGDRLSKKHTTRLTTELVRTDRLSKAGARWLPHECYQRQALS